MKPLLSALTLVVVVSLPVAAFAHAYPKHAQPEKNSVVSAPPAQVKIWFTEHLAPLFSKMVVKNAAGKVVSEGKAKVASNDAALLEVATPSLGNGKYQVQWKVTSKDGHHTHGDYSFRVDTH